VDNARTAIITTRPCRAPHHTIAAVGRIGGGHVPRLGEVSRAHHGMSFWAVWPECRCHDIRKLLGDCVDG
jgi:magnesium chelatase family protein